MTQKQTKRLTAKLQREFQDYHDDNIADSVNLPSRGNDGLRKNGSSGYMSNFLDSMSLTSAGSFRSIKDERADFRKKGQNILKKAEKEKMKQQRTGNSWLGGGDRG